MNIVNNEITGKNAELITTEIMFFVTSAKSLGHDLIKLKIKSIENEERDAKRFIMINKILRSIKKRGLIQLSVASTDFENPSTEVDYLRNKYPDLKSLFQNDNDVFFVLKL